MSEPRAINLSDPGSVRATLDGEWQLVPVAGLLICPLCNATVPLSDASADAPGATRKRHTDWHVAQAEVNETAITTPLGW